MNRKQIVDSLRTRIMEELCDHYRENGEDVLQVAGNEFCFPAVENGEDFYVKVKITIPNDKFDGYEENDGYETAQKLKAEKLKAKKEKLEKIKKV